MFLLNSSVVVAPMHCISPLARAGLSMFAASIDPEALPAPTRVCISSMKTIISCLRVISFMIALSLSSNSPLNFVPATIDGRSSEISFLPRRFLGTMLPTILSASPSTIADFPTPASPISSGLFFLRLPSICITRSISSFLPIIGSRFPFSASDVRSVPNSSSSDWRSCLFTSFFLSVSGI